MRFSTILAMLAIGFTSVSQAVSVEETIAEALRAAQPNLILQSASQVDGQNLYEVELTSGEVIYSTAQSHIQQKLTSLLGAREGDILGDLEGMSVTGDLLGA